MQIPEVGGAIVAMDPHTGRVHAVVGGFSFATSQFDRAVQARRQPGSSFKPLVYAAAIDNGYKPTSIVLDAPIEIDQGPGKEVWQPKNYDGVNSYGPSTLRTGIEKSRNQMTVRLAQDMGMPLIVEYPSALGSTTTSCRCWPCRSVRARRRCCGWWPPTRSSPMAASRCTPP
jgi:penicillin-binding protein 1A